MSASAGTRALSSPTLVGGRASWALLCSPLLLLSGCIGELPAYDDKTAEPWPFGRWVHVQTELPESRKSESLGTCVFAGSVDRRNRLPVVAALGTNRVEAFLDYVNFERLTVPVGPTEFFEAEISYPVRSTAIVPTRAGGLLRVKERFDYVEGHLWQGADGTVQIRSRNGDSALVQPPRKLVPEGRAPLSQDYAAWLPCSKLQLVPIPFAAEDKAPGLSGGILLRDEPDGVVVAEVGAQGDPIAILAEEGDWRHVAGLDEEYRYEGWIHADSIQKDSLVPRFSFQEPIVEPTHRALQDTSLSTSHRLLDEGIVLPKGRLVYVAESRRGISRVFVPHLRLLGIGAFFVRTEDLEEL